MVTGDWLAKVAYEAYGNSTGGFNFRGEPMPTWDDLPEEICAAWAAAVAAVIAADAGS
jgi:hypothetical protein